MEEFIEEFKGIKVGRKIKIKLENIIDNTTFHNLYNFFKNNKNSFTVDTIKEFEDTVIITVLEINEILFFNQVRPLYRAINSKKIYN